MEAGRFSRSRMKKKLHKIENTFSSIFSSHIDPENHKALEDKKEMDQDVQKMLELLRAEGDSNSSGRSDLIGLVNDFHRRYESLFGQYDHLVEKVKEKVSRSGGSSRSRREDLSFVLSSDSEEESGSLSNSSHHRGESEHDGVSIEEEEEYRALLEQLESAKSRNDELERDLQGIREENGSLSEQLESAKIRKDELETQLAEKEASIARLEHNIQCIREENGSLSEQLESAKSRNNKLETELSDKEASIGRLEHDLQGDEALRAEIERMREIISALEPENEALKEERREALQQLSVLSIASKAEKQSLEIQKTELEGKLGDLSVELEGARDQLTVITWSNEALENEKRALDTEATEAMRNLRQAEFHVKQLERELEPLRRKCSRLEENHKGDHLKAELGGQAEKKAAELERRLKEKEDEVLAMCEEKRKAIRQLCVPIEYHRESCRRLLEYVAAATNRK